MSNSQAQTSALAVDYDFAPVAELELEGTAYRVDAGFRGAVAISERTSGSWAWVLVAEGRWDGVTLKAKALERSVVAAIERALRAASSGED